MLTQREAAAACGVSRTTIRRRREAGELPGAVLDDDRGWLIPLEDLLAAGFRLNAPFPPDEKGVGDPAPAQAQQDPVGTDALRAELDRLRHEHALALAGERTARALAEARHCKARLDERAASHRGPAASGARCPRASPGADGGRARPCTAPPRGSDAAGGRARDWPEGTLSCVTSCAIPCGISCVSCLAGRALPLVTTRFLAWSGV
ncbi:hypothetical protein DIZ27_19285 [Streptomyces sp. NWU339]|uniref:helix-turn-helix domain-containing protein n=1 Tax=Streptomyces sp. NWU339 TaxID=2185284 RepID=UPI000D684AFB|nr:helix-turn-helix domain-containing protein [Streptomyces sp. NWU339]PWI09104.1 hypothetical protein DIZ27_19285 [Streptomyces sp. NWU339]